ncbi:caspase family protein [Phormidium tenue]|uniref:Caspase family protein n=1 Tax=Phormidium tenue FACHB-1050 TaxID=2692857 RepID=A0ABR8CD79_9CYAN|nr:caspase family protein [Phormidium tenue]MBD2318075.1 caspase family protein [Phormidium tenue FACHB-1050]
MAKVALLIGVSEYEVGLNPLPAAVKDVVAFERILKDSEMGDFDEVKILTNPEPQTMQYEIESLFSGRSKDDFVLLFFSGHGIKDANYNLYFATCITKKSANGDLIRSTAVPARFVHEVMNNSRAKRQVIILDCCYSGAFDPNLLSKDDGSVDLQGQLGAEGRVVLTSSSSTQYSFEQQGSDLSLYTRYLIEGIETGAGDRDEDGRVSVRELHDYATSKVQETAPTMTPKLITLKDMGFDLVLAKAKVTDPKLRYRRQVEKYSSRGAISSIGRTILDRLQIQLGLSAAIAKAIEIEVLRPYQERLDNLQRYQQAFEEAVKNEYPLSSYVKSELEDLLEILGLRREDIDSVEQEIITDFQAAREEYQQNLERQRLAELERQRQRDAEREKLNAEAKLQSAREAEQQRQERQNIQSRTERPNSPKLPFRLSRRNFMLVAGFLGVSAVAFTAIRGNTSVSPSASVSPSTSVSLSDLVSPSTSVSPRASVSPSANPSTSPTISTTTKANPLSLDNLAGEYKAFLDPKVLADAEKDGVKSVTGIWKIKPEGTFEVTLKAVSTKDEVKEIKTSGKITIRDGKVVSQVETVNGEKPPQAVPEQTYTLSVDGKELQADGQPFKLVKQ